MSIELVRPKFLGYKDGCTTNDGARIGLWADNREKVEAVNAQFVL